MSPKKSVLAFMVILLSFMMVLFLASCAGDSREELDDTDEVMEPRYGGVLNIGYPATPSTLDLHHGTGTAEHDIGDHMADPLYDICADYKPHPDLAENHVESEDRLIHTIKLKEGILFHDGTELTSEDVVASVERWLSVLSSPPELALFFDSVQAVDKYTVEFYLSQPTGEFLYMISSNPKIYPKALIDRYGTDHFPNEEIVGTGPYRLKEFRGDRYVHLVRFEDYEPYGEEIAGRAGRKNAYVDEIIFYIVPDSAVRMMGAESGQYHYGWGVEFYEYERLLDHPTVYPSVTTPYAQMYLPLNCANPPTDDVRIRQAIQAAIDADEIMIAALPEALSKRTCSKMSEKTAAWYSEVGCEYYNQANPEKAKQLMKEAGYNGEPIVLISISQFDFLKNGALTAAKQLENVGFKVDLRIVDLGTFIAFYLSETEWNMAGTSVTIYSTPTSYGWTRDDHVGWWEGETPRKKELGRLLRTEPDHEKRFKIWEEFQKLSYEEANHVWLGPFNSVSAASKKMTGRMNVPHPRLWNVWLKE